jgi:hypothetical protein
MASTATTSPGVARRGGCLVVCSGEHDDGAHQQSQVASQEYRDRTNDVQHHSFEFVAADPARFLAARYGLPISIAVVVADAAGLHGGRL